MVCTRDGRHAYIGCNDGIIRIWDLENGKEEGRFKDHQGCIYDVALSSDETLLASAGKDRIVRIWDANSCELLTKCPGHTNKIGEVAFGPQGLWVASASEDGTVRVWKVNGGKVDIGTEVRRFQQGDDAIEANALAISPDGKWIVSGGPQKKVRVWSVPEDKLVGTYEIHEQLVRADPNKKGWAYYWCVMDCGIRFHPSGDRVLSAGAHDKTVRIWSRANGKEISRFNLDFKPWRLSVSEDGRRLLIAGWDGTIRLWAIPQFGSEARAER